MWGRGHGWAVLATTELLAAAELGLDTEVVAAVTSLYRRHARLLLGAQSEDTGLWHNIITDTETFTETSASAMFLTGTLLYHVYITWCRYFIYIWYLVCIGPLTPSPISDTIIYNGTQHKAQCGSSSNQLTIISTEAALRCPEMLHGATRTVCCLVSCDHRAVITSGNSV